MTETITIAGEAFQAPVRYEEGHELTAGEASALNQTYHENLRNNFAKKVTEAKKTGAIDLAAFQAEFDTYAASYAFGVRTGGGGAPRDPVMSEALRIAKSMIRDALKKKGRKVSEVDASALNEKAKVLVQNKPEILALAKQRVAEQQAAAAGDLGDLIGDLPNKPAEATATPPSATPEPAAA